MINELEINNLKLTPKEQETLRKKIIRIAQKNLQPNGRVQVKKVAEICECSESHVKATWKKYQNGGVNAIKAVEMGRPQNSGELTSEQQQAIQKCLVDKDPTQLKLPGFLWNRSNIQGLIKQKYKVNLTLQAISKYLKKWGFTPQRPIKKNYKQNPEEIKTWLEEEYPEIKRRAKEENAEINWTDETGCQNESNYIKGYAPKGKTPVLPVGNEHIRVNMISSITNQGKLRFMFYRDKMNGNKLIKFMQRLIKDSKRKIFLILDNLKCHHAIIVQEWLEKHKDEIEVFYLPSYAPEYNPDEYLNGNLKRKLVEKGYSVTADEIESKARGIMKTLQNNPAHVASFFKAEKINYAC